MDKDVRLSLRRLNSGLLEAYQNNEPVRLHLPGIHPEYEHRSDDGLYLIERGSPLLVGRVATYGIRLANRQTEVVTVFRGNGDFSGQTFGMTTNVPTLNNMFETVGLPDRLRVD